MNKHKHYDVETLKSSVSIVDYLFKKGIEPSLTTGNQLVYLSPLTNEKSPSFYVDPRQNVFSCFSSDEKGDVLRLVRLMENKDFLGACAFLENFGNEAVNPISVERITKDDSEKTVIKSVMNLSNPSLIRYIESRGISFSLARKYVSEVKYLVTKNEVERQFYGVGFRNDSNGFEIRTLKYQGSIGVKDIRFFEGKDSLKNGCGVLIIFEGFFDFLSFLTHKRLFETPYDTIVLNSNSMLNRALPIIQNYSSIVSYLDNDVRGEKALNRIIEETRIPTLNASKKFFPNHNDYNDYLCQKKA